jgi:BMFP domain-containing protein YqiC
MTTGKLYESVAVQLSDAKLLELGKEQAAKHAEYKQVQEEKAEALNTFNARMKTLEAEIDDLANKVNNRVDSKDIEIREEFDYGRKMVIKVRADNGQPIGTRAMTLNEEGEEKMRQLREQGVEGDAEANGAPTDVGETPKGRRGRKAKSTEVDEAAAEE